MHYNLEILKNDILNPSYTCDSLMITLANSADLDVNNISFRFSLFAKWKKLPRKKYNILKWYPMAPRYTCIQWTIASYPINSVGRIYWYIKGLKQSMGNEPNFLICILWYLVFLAHLSRRLMGELIVYQSLQRPSVCQCFQTSSPLKPLGQLNSNFIWWNFRAQERKFVQMVQVIWPRWLPCPYMV